MVGRDNVVGMAACRGLDDSGIESRLGQEISHSSRPALKSTQPAIQWVTVSFPGVKQPGRRFDHPLPSSSEVKERIELYPYSPSGPSWTVLNFTFYLLPTSYISIYNVYLLIAYLG